MYLKVYFTIKLVLIFSNFHPTNGEPGKCREGTEKTLTPHQLLRQDVFCSYDKDVRPVVEHTSNTTITFKMFIKFFTLDETKNLMEVHSWVAMSWTDTHLKWNPANYGNITSLHVSNKDIWQPDLAIYNSGDMDAKSSWSRTMCVVYPEGTVLCVPTAKWSALCIPNIRQWPFDLHKCTMKIGSWAHTGEQINIVLQDGGVSLDDFEDSREWELQNMTASKNVARYDCCPNATYPSILYKFVVKRHADAYAATVIIPSLILAIMTLSSFWLDPSTPNRLALCSISTLCHCLFLQYLGAKLPSNGPFTPVIVLFYRDSLIITGTALLLAVIVQRISSSANGSGTLAVPTPAWLNRFVGVILDQKAGQILLLGKFDSMSTSVRGDGASLMENGSQTNENKMNQEWSIFVTIIDRLGFFAFLITYMVFFIALIPK